ncbi:MAG TPA: carboxypeptidase regulatory-like domain-containing protein [Symbiobacteriaceae bacterium]|nr:carboxypeptidase regulatory-like domain-containing protein [Symbiobacteriaceae bacterium]
MRRWAFLLLGLLLTAALALPVAAAPGASGATALVADEMGRPVAGAEVEVYKLGQGLVSTLTADAMGAVRLPGPMPAGTLWQLRVWAKGYRTAETGWVDLARTPYQFVALKRLLGDLQVTVIDRDGKPVNARVALVGPGGQLTGEWRANGGMVLQQGLLTGDYRLVVGAPGFGQAVRPVSVTGDRTVSAVVMLERATQVLSGEVRDGATGSALAGAHVVWLREDGAQVLDGGDTDSLGRFRMALAQGMPGRYQVLVRGEGYRPALTTPAALAPGQDASWNGPAAIGLVPINGAIAGTVVRDDGLPRPGVKVVLEARGFGRVAETVSDKDGFFLFDKVPADGATAYRVRIESELNVAESAWLALKPGVTERLVLKMKFSTPTAYGRGSLAAFVAGPDGKPLSGARVELFRRNALVKEGVTDAAGAFSVEDISATGAPWISVPGDPYTVRISKDGFVTTGEVTVAGQTAYEFHLNPESRVEFRATLLPAKIDLRGRVVDAEGRGIDKAEVYLLSGVAQAAPMTRSNPEGWFTFHQVNAAPLLAYELTAKAEGSLPVAGVMAVVRPGSGDTLPTLRMSPARATFTGQVLGASGQALAGVPVTLRDSGGSVLVTGETDAAGVYRLKVPVTALPVTAETGRDGWTRALAEVSEVPASGTVSRDLVILPLTARSSGRVLDPSGNPVAGMRVELLEDGRGIVAATRTDANGVYVFDGVMLDGPGLFWLRVDTTARTFAGSLRHGTELVPMLRLLPGQEVVTDLLVR